jgi:hypothetical protein
MPGKKYKIKPNKRRHCERSEAIQELHEKPEELLQSLLVVTKIIPLAPGLLRFARNDDNLS